MKNLGTTLGLWWLSTFDKSQFLFKSLKTIPVYFRYFFYILLTVALYFTITKLGANIYIKSYSIPVFIQSLLILIGFGIKVLTILFTIGIVNYESLYSSNFDVDSHFQELKQKREFIKINKLEKWRLRNMYWFIRILLYATIWAFLFHALQFLMINLFFRYENLTKEIYIAFLMDLITATIYLTVIYIILVSILDYFVRKNRRLK